jgi:hypothetical protein
MLKMAFKEWAVVCEAIARGEQTIILRKGGISEANGEFTPDHTRFWLYPTYFHEPQQSGIKPEYLPLLAEVESRKPAPGTIRLQDQVTITHVEYLRDLDAALALDRAHILSEATIRQRFHYRSPGLYVLRFERHSEPEAMILPEAAHYGGCKTWVEIDSMQ